MSGQPLPVRLTHKTRQPCIQEPGGSSPATRSVKGSCCFYYVLTRQLQPEQEQEPWAGHSVSGAPPGTEGPAQHACEPHRALLRGHWGEGTSHTEQARQGLRPADWRRAPRSAVREEAKLGLGEAIYF